MIEGCGIEVNGDGVNVRNTTEPEGIVGDGLEPGPDCKVKVKSGCPTVVVDEDGVSLDESLLAGAGLASDDDCKIKVGEGCGITVGTSAISVNAGDFAGDGLLGDGCSLEVVAGTCGIKVDSSGVSVDSSDLDGAGLKVSALGCEWEVGQGDCGIRVNANDITVVPGDFAGDGLSVSEVEGEECDLNVGAGCGIEVSDTEVSVKVKEDDYLWCDSSDGLTLEHDSAQVVGDITAAKLVIEGTYLVCKLTFQYRGIEVLEDRGLGVDQTASGDGVKVTEC